MRRLTAIRADIRNDWAAINAKAGTLACTLPKNPKLLGTGTKTEKGQKRGIKTAVVYMAPATEAFAPGDGRTMCPMATESCEAACLGTKAGRMAFATMANPRIWKATLFLGARRLFRELLVAEVAAFEKSALKAGYTPAVRIDGSSDTGEGALLAPLFPGTEFYDYTKVPARALKAARGGYAPNYRLVFSWSGENAAESFAVLAAGGSVAVVFDADPRKMEPLPAFFIGAQVIDGDVTDARFLDPATGVVDGVVGGVVVGLRFKQAKGRAAALRSAWLGGFVVAVDGDVDLSGAFAA